MIGIDEQIAYAETQIGNGFQSTPEEEAILASLQRLKEIEEADGRPGETPMLTTFLKQPLLLPVRQHIDALITHADHWRERAGRMEVLIAKAIALYADTHEGKCAAALDAGEIGCSCGSDALMMRLTDVVGDRLDESVSRYDAAIDEARKANG